MKIQSLRSSQDGMVSIIVTMIIMAILSLIVVGFAQLARQEQRKALDDQLSTQAFYAAESGINDAVKAVDGGTYTKNKPDCSTDASLDTAIGGTSTINGTTNVAYTCLTIDQSPETLEYGDVSTDKSTVVPINPVDVTNPSAPVPIALGALNISWNRSDDGGTTYFPGGGSGIDLPVSGATGWGSDRAAGILRLDITALGSTLTRDNLVSNTYTTFLYPSSGSATPTSINFQTAADKKGTIQKVNCNVASSNAVAFPHKCKAIITNLPAGVKNYYVRIISIYSDSKVTISGTDAVTGNLIHFKGAQYVVDSTGKANDVLKRIQVRKPAIESRYQYPDFAINSSNSICKLLAVYPGPPGSPALGGGTDGCTAVGLAPGPTPPVPSVP